MHGTKSHASTPIPFRARLLGPPCMPVPPRWRLGRWYQRRDSNSHWTRSERAASAKLGYVGVSTVRCARIELAWTCVSGRCPHQRASTASGGSGWQDSNLRSLGPGPSALARLSYTQRVGHLRIERSTDSVSESPGPPVRHDPGAEREDSNSPGSACRAVVLARGLAPRFGRRCGWSRTIALRFMGPGVLPGAQR